MNRRELTETNNKLMNALFTVKCLCRLKLTKIMKIYQKKVQLNKQNE